MTGSPSARDGRLLSRPGKDQPARPLAPGLHELDLGAGTEALLAVPPGPAVPRPLLVFFHGAGGTAAQSLAAVGEPTARVGALLLATSSGAATWDLIAGGLGRDVAVLDAALQRVGDLASVTRVALGGFSDGASYALSLGLANGDLAEAVLAFSPGFAAPPGTAGRPRIWLCHGRQDSVLPVNRCGRRIAGSLTAAGYELAYEEFDGGHAVTPELVTAALGWWLRPPS